MSTTQIELPGGWVPVYASTQPKAYSELTAEERSEWESIAAEYLWRWTGRIFGLEQVTLLPYVLPFSGDTFHGRGPVPNLHRWAAIGSPASIYCARCARGGCICRYPYSLVLPGPVDEVDEVNIKGDALDPSAYIVEGGNRLTRVDGESWPRNGWLSPKAIADDEGWSVTYMRGAPLPYPGKVALGILSIEFWKAHNGDNTCQLPRRLTSITREGVQMQFLDNFDDIDKGHTGIWLVDSWVSSIINTPMTPVIASPDSYPARFR